mmetsp:Transcript_26579/g.78203  ORF Transcript_26579/g.78203 Transcript_26579/m.78203 type:complete len:262 (-) Transcript_26579:244-1029(-)
MKSLQVHPRASLVAAPGGRVVLELRRRVKAIHAQARHEGGPRGQARLPGHELGEALLQFQVLARTVETREASHPREVRHVRERERRAEEEGLPARRELALQDVAEALHLHLVARVGVRDATASRGAGCVLVEVAKLTEEGPRTRLEEDPGQDFGPRSGFCRQQGRLVLLREVDQNGTRLEDRVTVGRSRRGRRRLCDRERCTAIDKEGNFRVGAARGELGAELVPRANVDEMGVVGYAKLLKENGHLLAIWRAAAIQLQWR